MSDETLCEMSLRQDRDDARSALDRTIVDLEYQTRTAQTLREAYDEMKADLEAERDEARRQLDEARGDAARMREALERMDRGVYKAGALEKCNECGWYAPSKNPECRSCIARAALTGTPAAPAPGAVLDPRDAEIARLKNLIDRDRTGLAAALVEVKKRANGGRWISEGRGSYRYDEGDYRKETGWLVADIVKLAEDALRASGNLANEAFHPLPASRASTVDK